MTRRSPSKFRIANVSSVSALPVQVHPTPCNCYVPCDCCDAAADAALIVGTNAERGFDADGATEPDALPAVAFGESCPTPLAAADVDVAPVPCVADPENVGLFFRVPPTPPPTAAAITTTAIMIAMMILPFLLR